MISVQSSVLLLQRTELAKSRNVSEEICLREALKKSEDRCVELRAENRQAAALGDELSASCDKQLQRNDELREQLRSCQTELQQLRLDDRLEAVMARDWEAGRLKELPKLKTELKQRLACQAEYHLQSLEEDARRRVAMAERNFSEQVRNLEAELNEAKETNALLGRKCFASYQAAAQAQGASHYSQVQSMQLQQELQYLRAERVRLQQELQKQQDALNQEEAAAASFKSKLEAAESASNRSHQVSRELQEWMLMSLNEVNRSAHPTGQARGRLSPASVESNWVEMLENFRKHHQVRNGYGCRTK
eukprot:Skav219316  [mRNA]  locus=scaffold1152:167234:168148:- [translate_table: standard]